MITYMREVSTFSESKALELIQLSIDSSQIEVDKVLFRNDLTESTCMLILDGLDYTFSHRSFQEYFSAYFLSHVKTDEFNKAIPRLVQRGSFDNVLRMISEMNKEKFEEAWALPTLRNFCKRLEKVNPKENCIGYAVAMVGGQAMGFLTHLHQSDDSKISITIHDDPSKGKSGRQKIDLNATRSALYHVYDIFDVIAARLKTGSFSDNDVIRKLRTGQLLGDDPRFEALRNPSKEDSDNRFPLKESDSSWLRETKIGKFIELEGELLPKLRDDLTQKVEQRKLALEAIFPRLAR